MTEDECSARTVRQEMHGKDDRARRGKVGHLRDEAPHTNRTICGVNADSERTRTVSREEWRTLDKLQCINCRRSLGRLKMQQAPMPFEASPAPVHWIRSHPESKSAEERGLHCGAPYSGTTRASSYREQVTCAACRAAADGESMHICARPVGAQRCVLALGHAGECEPAECDEDAAICDCSYHENARRAEATHSAP